MRPENPFQPGCFAHQQFETFVVWFINQPTKLLEEKRDQLRKDAENFCAHSWKAMMDFDFQADVIDKVLEGRKQ